MTKMIKPITLTSNLLEDIAMAMEDNSFENNWYFDILEEKIVLVSDYSDEDEELAEVIENGYCERFFPIPQRESRESWEQMERFILSQENLNDNTRGLLMVAIEGRGAFGRFKDAIYRIGIQDKWFDFKGREDWKEALDWLLSINMITEKDITKGMKLYEEKLAGKKQKESDLTNMTKGASVECIYNDGHINKLTPGKKYTVLEERREHLLIRIKDDRDIECWLPKSHFGLIHTDKN